MSTVSRTFTVRPTAAPREQFSVLVIDRSVEEAEEVCAALREDGHVVEVRTYDDDLTTEIAALRPQVVAVRLRKGAQGRAVLAAVKRVHSHLHVVGYNAQTARTLQKRLPACWTDMYRLAAPRVPYFSPRILVAC